MNEILKIEPYSEKTARVRILNPVIAAKYEPGHFVIVKFRTDGHRIPFSIIDANREEGSIDIIIHRADGLDEILSMIEVGESLPDLLGPLGHPAVIEPESRILFFGDGAGVVPLLPLIRAAKEKGCKVKRDCDAVVTVSDDNMLESAINFVATEPIDKVLMSGPTLMMKRLANETKERGIPAECILNMLMIDGIGLCGICRVIVGGERKQTCTDGPIFDAHQVDFDQMFNRQRLFV